MIKVLFVCHGSTSDSRELAALVGQNGAKRGKSRQLGKWVTTVLLRVRKLKIRSVENGDKKDKWEILML